MTQPPSVTPETDILTVAQLMANAQTYTLPVCEAQKIVGVIDIHQLKESIQSSPNQDAILKNIRVRQATTISHDDSIRNAISLMHHHRNKWIVVTDIHNQPRGIIHTGHLLSVMLVDDNKQRFGKNRAPWTNWAFDTEPNEFSDRPLNTIITPNPAPVVTKIDAQQIMHNLLLQHSNAVVVMENNQISGIVTIRELCEAYSKAEPAEEVSIAMQRPSASVTDHEFLRAQSELRHFVSKMNKRLPIQRIEVGVEEPKYSNRQTAIYNTAITVIPYTKGTYYAQGHEKLFSYSIRSALKQIEKQQQRDHQESTNYDTPSISELTREI